MEQNPFKNLKTLYARIEPAVAFLVKSRTLVLATPLKASACRAARATLWESFVLGSALTLAGVLTVFLVSGGAVGGSEGEKTAQTNDFNIHFGEIRYDVRAAANVALGKLESDLRSGAADSEEILRRIEELKRILN